MLEDELREMFSARVSTPPAALDPAGVAIKQGRRSWHRRRLTIAIVSLVAFAGLLGAAGLIKIFYTPISGVAESLTYDGLFGTQQPDRGDANPLPTISLPVDVYVGTSLFTTDGRKLMLSGVDQVIDVVRVPAGWLYSDDIRLRLLTPDNVSVPVRDNLEQWLVSTDGTKVATVAKGAMVEVIKPDGKGTGMKTVIPVDAHLEGFTGPRVVFGRENYGSAYWDGQAGGSTSNWNDRVLAYFPALNDGPMALVRDGEAVCLADLVVIESVGWQIGERVGCGDLLATAARAVGGLSAPTRSPDGRWLAIPTLAGIQLVDLNQARTSLDSEHAAPPVISQTCVSSPDAPAVWASATTVVTLGSDSRILACGVDGSRHTVQLPAGVTAGWALVPRFGVPG